MELSIILDSTCIRLSMLLVLRSIGLELSIILASTCIRLSMLLVLRSIGLSIFYWTYSHILAVQITQILTRKLGSNTGPAREACFCYFNLITCLFFHLPDSSPIPYFSVYCACAPVCVGLNSVQMTAIKPACATVYFWEL